MIAPENIDTRLVDLPPHVPGLSCVDDEGTPMIYLNARHTYEMNLRTFEHELEHLRRDDFHNGLPIEQAEPGIPPARRTYAELWDDIHAAGFKYYALELDDPLWDILFGLWIFRTRRDRYDYVLNGMPCQYTNRQLGMMVNRIFRDTLMQAGDADCKRTTSH